MDLTIVLVILLVVVVLDASEIGFIAGGFRRRK